MNASVGAFRRCLGSSLKFCGSIKLSVAIMTLLAFAMGWATFLEREMGTPVAQHAVYAANWFYFLIFVLAFNILCASLLRLPRLLRAPTKTLAAFYLAHLGVVLLLIGCWTTAKHSTKAHATISESAGVEKAVDVDSRLFEIELAQLGADADQTPQKVELPFAGGPLNWKDYDSKANWTANVDEPLLALKPEGKFFQNLAKSAAKHSHAAAYYAAKFARKAKPGVLYDKDGLKLEVLDYATYADLAPVKPLKGSFALNGKKNPFELRFEYDMNAVPNQLTSSRRGQRVQLDDGTRVVYMIADSQRDYEAFKLAVPDPDDPNLAPIAPDDENADLANAFVVLVVDGKRYQKRLVDLAMLASYGDLDSQNVVLAVQREEIARRLKQEEERTDVSEEERDSAKPLSTVTRDDLTAQTKELRELSSKMTDAADAATATDASQENANEFAQTRQEFERKRVLNYLATTWSQLENVTQTSKEFRQTLKKMQEQNDRRLEDVAKLADAVKLGDSQWRIVGFETSPTLVPEVDELQGWSALASLRSPEGKQVDVSLFSELYERNKFDPNGRVFGALWIADLKEDDNEYGRPWAKTLGKPKLELMQDLSGRVAYRVCDGKNHVETGELDLAPAADRENAPTDVYSAKSVALNDAKNNAFDAFVLDSVPMQDEIGVRLVPGAFQKDQANPFYGKARVRVTLDDVCETFLLRAIPLESIAKEQIPYLERKIVSSKRQATVRFTDREIDLGAALFVKKFSAVYEPGSSTAVSFSSLTRVLPKDLTLEEQRQAAQENSDRDVLIQMNRPGVLKAPGSKKVYWAYQDSFRGPYRPGDPEFDSVVQGKLLTGEDKPREFLYQTIITLNDDPGRGMKYLGSLFVVWGTAMLVYRRKSRKNNNGGALRQDKAAENALGSKNDEANAAAPYANENALIDGTADANAARSGKTSPLLLAALTFALTSCACLPNFFADEIVPPEEVKQAREQKLASQADADRLDWSALRLMPVYDGGRRQPLNTFAEILVRDTTGSKAPTILLPGDVLERLESDKPLNFPSLDEFLKDVGTDPDAKENDEDDAKKRAEQEAWYKEVASQAVARQNQAAKKLRAIFPNGKHKFEAVELLFSWIVEPELWEYVPFLDDPKNAVAVEALKRSPEECAKRGGRLSPEDFDAVDLNGKLRVDVFRAQARGDAAKADALKALDKFEERVANYRSLAFVPTSSASNRPSFYLNKIMYGDSSMNMGMHAAMGGARGSGQAALTKLDAASASLEKLMSREKRALRKESPFYDKEYILRQKTPIEGDAQGRETLMLARQLTALAGMYQRYPLSTSGFLFDKLFVSLTQTLKELKAHRDACMAEEKFSLEYRKQLQQAVSALESIVGNLELAYLSLTSEPSKTLNVSPVVRASLFRASETQDAPWLPLQTFLFASDSAYARFVDPRLLPDEDKPQDGVERNVPKDKEKLSPFDDFEEALEKTLANSKYPRPAARAFLDAAKAYRDRNAENRAKRFNHAIQEFANETRELADNIESLRVELAIAEIEDDKAREEFLAKTCYNVPRGLKAELFYYKLNAFYWNWVACLAALICFAASYARQCVRKFASKEKEPLNERLFFALGLVFLTLSCAVAFLGGATRAYITGWAPVANMFETVVLLAFLIAAIAVGYALAPAWTTPYLNAWRMTGFPTKKMPKEELIVSFKTFFPRLVVIAFCFVAAYRFWRIGHADLPVAQGLAQTFRDAFAMKGALDSFAVLITFLFTIWAVPRFVVTLGALVCFPKRTFARPDLEGSSKDKLREIGAQIVQRKAFITASSIVALAVAASAYFNSVEFNPNIRPLVAVLRSNFWLTIHVVAIIVSYALGAIAWVVAIVSLASYIFGKYNAGRGTNANAKTLAKNDVKADEKTTAAKPSKKAKANGKNAKGSKAYAKNAPKNASKSDVAIVQIAVADAAPNEQADPNTLSAQDVKIVSDAARADAFEPEYAQKTSPIVATMIRSAVLFLTAGIILGARWADFSWGRFWSWDPKEVWALVTLMIYLVVLHAHKISGGKRFVLALGANFGALAIVMTWYGLSFVMGGGGRHAYAAGESNKIVVLYALFAVNIAWAALAIARYWFEKIKSKRANAKAAQD